jgi:hypothetical protein
MKRTIQIIVYWGIAFVLGSLWITFMRGIHFGGGALFGSLFAAFLTGIPIYGVIVGHKFIFSSSQKDIQKINSGETHQTPNNVNEATEGKIQPPLYAGTDAGRPMNPRQTTTTNRVEAKTTISTNKKNRPNRRGQPGQVSAPELQQAKDIEKVAETNEMSGWSEEFQILNEYDPVVRECHDELEDLEPQLSSQFREEVVSDRKKAAGIRDRLKAEHEKKLKPYASESLNEALAEARLLGPNAEKEFTRVIEVMGEDIDVENVFLRLKEKYDLSTPPDKDDFKLEYWGIERVRTQFALGNFKYNKLDDAIMLAQAKLNEFLNEVPTSKLLEIFSSCGYEILPTSDRKQFRVGSKGGASVALLKADELPAYIKNNISPNEIRKHADYLSQTRTRTPKPSKINWT